MINKAAEGALRNRNSFVDTAKGVSIILVAVGHSYFAKLYPESFGMLSLVRMPLFFLLSGIFFSHKLTFPSFALDKAEALLKPYMTAILPFFLLKYLVLEEVTFFGGLYSIMYSVGSTIYFIPALWYLTHLYVVFICSYCILKYVRVNSFVAAFIYLLGIFYLGENESYASRGMHYPGWVFSADLLVLSVPLFIVGSNLKHKLLNFKPNQLMFLGSGLLFALSAYQNGFLDFNLRASGSHIFTFLGSIAAIYLTLTLVYCMTFIEQLAGVFAYMGKQSLFILIFHTLVLRRFEGFITEQTGIEQILLTLVSLITSILVSLLLALVIRRLYCLSILFLPSKTLIRTKRNLFFSENYDSKLKKTNE